MKIREARCRICGWPIVWMVKGWLHATEPGVMAWHQAVPQWDRRR